MTANERAKALTALGYRRVSWSYRTISRIDRPDWVYWMAAKHHHPPADLYVPGTNQVSGSWCDYYRRVYSKDKITDLPHEVIQHIPSSCHDPVGFVFDLPIL